MHPYPYTLMYNPPTSGGILYKVGYVPFVQCPPQNLGGGQIEYFFLFFQHKNYTVLRTTSVKLYFAKVCFPLSFCPDIHFVGMQYVSVVAPFSVLYLRLACTLIAQLVGSW